MEMHYETEHEPGMASLIAGIMQDARQLFVQQLQLFQTELKNEVHQAIYAIAPLILGAVLCVPAVLLLGMACAYFLSWAIPELPLWGGFLITGGGVILLSAILMISGKVMLDRVHIVPEKTLEGLKENIQWKTKT